MRRHQHVHRHGFPPGLGTLGGPRLFRASDRQAAGRSSARRHRRSAKARPQRRGRALEDESRSALPGRSLLGGCLLCRGLLGRRLLGRSLGRLGGRSSLPGPSWPPTSSPEPWPPWRSTFFAGAFLAADFLAGALAALAGAFFAAVFLAWLAVVLLLAALLDAAFFDTAGSAAAAARAQLRLPSKRRARTRRNDRHLPRSCGCCSPAAYRLAYWEASVVRCAPVMREPLANALATAPPCVLVSSR